MTLQRRRSRLQLESSALHKVGAGARNSMEFPETAEFDELISSLKTGAYFRRKNRPNSTSRRVEVSRERPTSTIALETTREQS